MAILLAKNSRNSLLVHVVGVVHQPRVFRGKSELVYSQLLTYGRQAGSFAEISPSPDLNLNPGLIPGSATN